jgi:beta-galactosidase
MKVLLRPGPYICGEWDFGGMPARLLGIEDLKIRSSNLLFLNEVNIFFKSLAPFIKPYVLAKGGPIQMIQIEN